MDYGVFIAHPNKSNEGLNGSITIELSEIGEDIYILEESSVFNRDFKKGTIFKGKLMVDEPVGPYHPAEPEVYRLNDYQVVRFGMMGFSGRVYNISSSQWSQKEGSHRIQAFRQSPLFHAISAQTAAVGGLLETLQVFSNYLYIHLPKGKDATFDEIEQLPGFDLELVAFED